MLESIITTSTIDSTVSLVYAIATMAAALITGAIISFTYMKTHPKGNHSQNFSLTLILLPAVIAIIILLIGSNIARAFSLAGAFSIIRFRSEPGEPKDIAYVLFAMAAGLATGVGTFVYAVLFTVILCVVMYVLSMTNYGETRAITKELRITVPEDLDYEKAFEDVFHLYTYRYKLVEVKTSAMGSLYQLRYEIELNQAVDLKKFMDELRCRNSNLNITLMV